MNTPKTPETAKDQKRLKPNGDPPPKKSSLVELVKVATEGSGRRKGSSSWVVYLIVSAIVVAAFTILGWNLVRTRRKVAKLSYELRRNKEEQKSIAQEYLFSKGKLSKEVARAKVIALEEGAQKLRKKLVVLDKRHKDRLRAVDEAMSWKDLGL